VGSFKNLLTNHRTGKAQIYTIKASCIFTCVYFWGKKNLFPKTSWPISIKLGANHPHVKGI
jgi:hypothetical protein